MMHASESHRETTSSSGSASGATPTEAWLLCDQNVPAISTTETPENVVLERWCGGIVTDQELVHRAADAGCGWCRLLGQ